MQYLFKTKFNFRSSLKAFVLLLLTFVVALQPLTLVYAEGEDDTEDDPISKIINQGLPAYIPGDGGCSDGVQIALPDEIKTEVEKNKVMYQSVADQPDIDLPWQVLAGIHYREASFNTSKDLQAGNPFGGPYKFESTSYAKYGYPADIQQSILFAAKELQDKAQAGLFKKRITAKAIDSELIKDALFGYNGRAQVYIDQAKAMGFNPLTQPFEGSPYVMSRFDAKHMNMGIITKDHGGIDGIDKRYGAFTIYAMLGGPMQGSATGECVVSGDLISTIVLYAWPKYRNPRVDAAYATTLKPPYAAAVVRTQKAGLYDGYEGVDCGAFVTITMRDSHTDDTYNSYQGPTGEQLRYLQDQAKAGKYKHLTDVNDRTGTKNLLPGDIAVNDGHTYFYVGDGIEFVDPETKIKTKFEGNAASASGSGNRYSGSDRAPMASPAYGFSSFQWYRKLP